MDFEKLLEQEARKAARQDYEEVTEKTKKTGEIHIPPVFFDSQYIFYVVFDNFLSGKCNFDNAYTFHLSSSSLQIL